MIWKRVAHRLENTNDLDTPCSLQSLGYYESGGSFTSAANGPLNVFVILQRGLILIAAVQSVNDGGQLVLVQRLRGISTSWLPGIKGDVIHQAV